MPNCIAVTAAGCAAEDHGQGLEVRTESRTGYKGRFLPWSGSLENSTTPDLQEKWKGVGTITPIALMDKLKQAEKVEKAPPRSQ